ncbi:MAG: TonB family protein [Flavobacteriales bacterium]|nr:TonB family protein [Flavobacteriales bacterium]
MNNWLSYFFEVNIYLLIIGLGFQFGFKKNRNYQFGRPFLIIGTLSAFIFPFLKFEKLAAVSKDLITEAWILEPVTILPTQYFSFDYQLIIIAIIGIGALTKITITAFGFFRLFTFKKKTKKEGRFYTIPSSAKAFSFFNSIFIGEKIPASKKEIIYKHELVHVQKRHSIDVLFMQLVQAIAWYNPAVYLTTSNLKELHEYEADQLCQEDSFTYVELLLQQSFENYNLSFIHQFNSNHIKNRIMRIQKKTNQRISKVALLTTLSILFGSFAISQNSHLVLDNQLTQFAENRNPIKESSFNSEDKMAEYPGGQTELFNFLGNEIIYPKISKGEKSEGTVYVSFIVGIDGTCTDFNIKRGVSESLNNAALVALKKMPKWIPGTKDGENIAMEMTIPIKFVLPEPEAPKSPDK